MKFIINKNFEEGLKRDIEKKLAEQKIDLVCPNCGLFIGSESKNSLEDNKILYCFNCNKEFEYDIKIDLDSKN